MAQKDEFASYGSGSGADPGQSPSSFVGFDRYFGANAQTAKASGDAVAAQVQQQANQVKNQFDQASGQYQKNNRGASGYGMGGKQVGGPKAPGAFDSSAYQQQVAGLSAPTTDSLQTAFQKQNAGMGDYSATMSAWDAALAGRASQGAFDQTNQQLKGLSQYFGTEGENVTRQAQDQWAKNKAAADRRAATVEAVKQAKAAREAEAARIEAARQEQERQAREGTDPDERTIEMSPEAWSAATGRPIEEY
jgi:hypothetical protein